MGIIESVVLDKPRLKIHFTSTTNADFFYSQYSLTFPFHIKFTATGAKSAIRSLVAIGDFANCLSTQNAILESLPFYLIFFFYSSFVETFFFEFSSCFKLLCVFQARPQIVYLSVKILSI